MIGNTRILVVDDNAELLEEIHEILNGDDNRRADQLIRQYNEGFDSSKINIGPGFHSACEYKITSANSGEDAYRIVRDSVENRNPFAVVFLDIGINGYGGFKAAEKIKNIDDKIEFVFTISNETDINSDIPLQLKTPDEMLVLRKPFIRGEIRQLAYILTAKWNSEQILIQRNNDLAESLWRNKKQKSYLDSIVSLMPLILISTDSDAVIIQWNYSAEKCTGFSREQTEGRILWDICPCFSGIEDSFNSVLELKRSVKIGNEKIILRRDKTLYADITFHPVITDEIEGVVIIIEDISVRIELEDQLVQAQKMEIVGTLAGGLTHDFNNVLGGITGTVSTLKYLLDKEGLDKDRIMTYVKLIQDASDRAADMVNQILSLSRKQKLNLGRVDLNEAARHVMQICGNTFDKCIKLNPVFYNNSPALIKADITQIEQVLLNLCVNASHAMTIMEEENKHKGGVLSLSIESVPADPMFCVSHPDAYPGKYWLIRVDDTGVGIDPGIIRRIFDPFFSTKEQSMGSGLGLSMVSNIVKQHGGFIDVESVIGEGTSFLIYLPGISGIYLSETGKSDNPGVMKGSGLILVVDDESIMQKTAGLILDECGYQVLSALNGEEALDLYMDNHNDIDLVFLDLAMPGMSGMEVYIELKKINPGVKVLLASGYKKDSRITDVKALGVNGFIEKPYSLSDLSGMISTIIG